MPAQAWITLVGAMLALAAFVVGLAGTARDRVRQTEDFYLKRYWDLLAQLPMDGLPTSGGAGRRAIRQYIDLCEDELTLRERGQVSWATWQDWREGMVDGFSPGPVRDEWSALAARTAFGHRHLRQLIGDERYDPCEKNWWVRRWRNLGP
ncbi:hypothetical protein [Streptomyces sp. NPDC048442]|uniref:hypothetical protein n=1 Tax=Streptomyces sp. NPDC048442 TaxID=3154823 RepID=UPI003415CFAA